MPKMALKDLTGFDNAQSAFRVKIGGHPEHVLIWFDPKRDALLFTLSGVITGTGTGCGSLAKPIAKRRSAIEKLFGIKLSRPVSVDARLMPGTCMMRLKGKPKTGSDEMRTGKMVARELVRLAKGLTMAGDYWRLLNNIFGDWTSSYSRKALLEMANRATSDADKEELRGELESRLNSFEAKVRATKQALRILNK